MRFRFWFFSAVLVATLAAACGDVTVAGPVPVTMEGEQETEEGGVGVEVEIAPCTVDSECDSTQLCLLHSGASERAGYWISLCQTGCDVQLVERFDGSVTKVAGSDTCQRDGRADIFCDADLDLPTFHMCREPSTEELAASAPAEDPTPPPQGGDEDELSCCYSGDTVGLFGQFAWSESSVENPEEWRSAYDLEIGSDGCFAARMDLSSVYSGFWVDLTRGLARYDRWQGSTRQPLSCYLNGRSLAIRSFEPTKGWRIGTVGD